MAQDFYDDSYEEYDDYENNSYAGGGYEWTEEDEKRRQEFIEK